MSTGCRICIGPLYWTSQPIAQLTRILWPMCLYTSILTPTLANANDRLKVGDFYITLPGTMIDVSILQEAASWSHAKNQRPWGKRKISHGLDPDRRNPVQRSS